MKVEFYKHNVSEVDIANVVSVLRTPFLTTGTTVNEFEELFSQYLRCKYTIGVTSCTAALHLALLACGIGPGDEVITTPMTFIATADAIIYTGAKPVFVDVELDTGNMNAGLIEQAITPSTRAILPVHLYGQMCDMLRIRQLAEHYKLYVVEDAAHAIEARRDGIRPAQLGDAACFSFYTTKSITCGEGGAISTNNPQLQEKLKKLRLHGMSKGAAERYTQRYQHWDMELLGWKYNMSNIQAALLLNQVKHLDYYSARRQEISQIYEQAFVNIPYLSYPVVLPGSSSARYIFTILVPPERRDDIIYQLQEKGIGIAVNFRAIHLLTYYQNTYGYKRGTFPVAEHIGDSTITLPLYPKLKDEEIEYVIRTVKGVLK